MSWEYTGLPGPGDVLEGAGLIDSQPEEQLDLDAGPVPVYSPIGVPVLPAGSTGLLTRAGAALGIHVGAQQDTGQHFEDVTGYDPTNPGGDAPFWARLLNWLLENPGKAAVIGVFLYVTPLLASTAEVAANVTED